MNIKRIAIAGVAAASLAGGSFAFAANLGVTNQTLASGSNPVDAGCSAIAVNWTPDYVSPNKYELTTITLDGGTGCTTQAYKVTVAKSDGTSLHEYTGSLASGDASISATGEHIDANLVGNVTAVVTGAAVSAP